MMNGKYVDSLRFDHAYKQLLYVTRSNSPSSEISFRTGFWDSQEGYKYEVWEEARKRMAIETWPELRTDYASICKLVVQAFFVVTKHGDTQNLVSKENSFRFDELISKKEKAAASVIYSLFYGDNDAKSFTDLANLIVGKVFDPISVIGYLFFLKDKDKYAPVRKSGTAERLNRLSINGAFLTNCTWNSYQHYLQIIAELQSLLLKYHPETTFLDAQSFLWMLNLIDYTTPEYKEKPARILFCNITWMEFYDQICFPHETPRFGGSFVKETGTAFESRNFHRYEDGYYGFVETKYRGGTAIPANANQLHIEKIDQNATGDSVDDVTVVFCAHSEKLGKTVVVGWYKNATVFRRRKTHSDGHDYNLKAKDAVLLPEVLRTKVIPRAKEGGFGFGQSNIRYPIGEGADNAVKEVLSYIKRYDDSEEIERDTERTLASLSLDDIKKLAGEASDKPAPKYSVQQTQRKRNMYLPELIKRMANGKCQLCGQILDYKDSAGRPYLEAHHIIPLADDGPDSIDNMVALCPNCHRKMHVEKAWGIKYFSKEKK